MTLHKFKRVTALLLAIAMMASLTACFSSGTPEESTSGTTPPETTEATTVPVETTSPTETTGVIVPPETIPTETTQPTTEPTTAPTEPSTAVLYGTVTAGELRIRKSPSTSATIMGSLLRGTRVEILETKEVKGVTWGRVEKGWISMDYVKLSGDPGDVIGKGMLGTVTTDGLRIRSKATTDSSVVGELPKGQRIGFDKFTHCGNVLWGHFTEGWVSLSYVDLDAGYKAGSPLKGVVTANELRVRSAPGTNNEVLTTLTKGKQVTISEYYTVGSDVWGFNGQGWVSLDYVEFDIGIELRAGTNTEPVQSTGNVGGSWMYISSDYLTIHTPSVSTLLLASDGSFYFGSTEYAYSASRGWYSASGASGCYGTYTARGNQLTTVTTADDYEGVMNKYDKPITDKTTISVSGNVMTLTDGDKSYLFVRTSSVYEYVTELIQRNPGSIGSAILGTWEHVTKTSNGWQPGGHFIFNDDNTFTLTVTEYTYNATNGWVAKEDSTITHKGLYIYNDTKLTLLYQSFTDAAGKTTESKRLLYISDIQINGDTMTGSGATYMKNYTP